MCSACGDRFRNIRLHRSFNTQGSVISFLLKSSSHVNWLIFLFICLTWGSSFILMKKGLLAFTPVEMAILRVGIAALAFLPVYLLHARRHIAWNKLGYIALVGILGNGLPAIFYAIAQTRVESSVAGILNSLTPIFTWTIGVVLFAAAFRLRHLTGVLTGFAGAALIVLFNHRFQLSIDAFTLFIVVATVCYGFSANIVKRYLQDVHPVALSAVAMLTIGAPALAASGFTGIYDTLLYDRAAFWPFMAIVALALVGTVLANMLFFRLIQRTSAVFASSVAYLIPVTALGWGMLDGEALAVIHLLGMSLILTGVWLLHK